MKKITLACILVIVLVQCLFVAVALADSHSLADGDVLDISTLDAGDTVNVDAGASVTISGSQTNIQINCGAGAKVTLKGITINNSIYSDTCPLSFTGIGNTLTLAPDTTNTLTAGANEPGIRVESGAELTISGTGTLSATGGAEAAGIGSGKDSDSGAITILGGNITAAGSSGAAGIGSGNNTGTAAVNCGTITISGGTIHATGSTNNTFYGGAGIGGGYFSNVASIIISGGNITAQGGYQAAGIGSGRDGSCGTITISNATIIATGGYGGAGIGGAGDTGDAITISSGNITATGGGTSDSGAGAGIGSPYDKTGCSITINGGTIIAEGGSYDSGAGAGIGSGGNGTAGIILITGGDITATGGYNGYSGGTGIGIGYEGDRQTITISGGIVKATGKGENPGIGGCTDEDATSVEISGGTVFATGGGDADYDIGHADPITISGSAAVFLKNDKLENVLSTTTHTHDSTASDFSDSSIYRVTLPSGWTGKFGMYLRPITLTYDANGGSGAPSAVKQIYNSTASVADGNGLTLIDYVFNGWNTATNGSGTSYAAGGTFTFTANTTLYAQWAVEVTAVSGNSAYGSVSGGGNYAGGAEVTLTATANSGYAFTGWYNGSTKVSSDNPYTFNASQKMTLTAQFVPVYTITAQSSNAAYGSVSGGGSYPDGAAVSLTATPASGCRFVRWTENGAEVSANAHYSFTITGNRTLVAVFEKDASMTPDILPVGISCTKTDVTIFGAANGSITVTASGGNSGSYEYAINGSWQGSGTFGNVAAGTYMAAVRDAGNRDNAATCSITVGQPSYMGNVLAKKLPSKPLAGNALTIIPPAAPKGYTTQSVSFSSSNPSVASVDANGNVTFLAGGKVTIITKIVSQMTDKKGRIKTKTTTVKKTVTVKQPIASVSLNMDIVTIARKSKVKLMSSIAPVTASSKKLKWTTSNKKVATVSGAGVVTGKAGGTAVITCTALDGSGVSASCTVNVTPIYPTGIKMSKAALTVKAGKIVSLKATILSKTTDFKTVTWASSNPAVATVNVKGKVMAIAPGTTTITATTSNGISVSCTVTVQ